MGISCNNNKPQQNRSCWNTFQNLVKTYHKALTFILWDISNVQWNYTNYRIHVTYVSNLDHQLQPYVWLGSFHICLYDPFLQLMATSGAWPNQLLNFEAPIQSAENGRNGWYCRYCDSIFFWGWNKIEYLGDNSLQQHWVKTQLPEHDFCGS